MLLQMPACCQHCKRGDLGDYGMEKKLRETKEHHQGTLSAQQQIVGFMCGNAERNNLVLLYKVLFFFILVSARGSNWN